MSQVAGFVGAGRMADRATSFEDRGSDDIRKVAVASAIGNMIEYYDFTLYATATALVFNKVFFPSSDPLVGSLLRLRHSLSAIARDRLAACCLAISATASAARPRFSSPS